MNRRTLQELVKGEYGRKIAYTDVDEITQDNVVSVVGSCIGVFHKNAEIARYLWNYKNGDQPSLYREKTIRDDICNTVVENHAWEIVQFKIAQTNGEPIQCVALKKDDKINEAVDRFNDYCRGAFKHARDIDCDEWTSAVGTGYKAVRRRKNSEVPFMIIVPTPLDTFVIYQKSTKEPMLAVQRLKDANGRHYLHCFSATHEYKIQDSKLLALNFVSDEPVYSRLHAFGGIPIVEYPNNQDRISDIELVISMLDAINEVQSNRVDGIAQFVQSWVKFINCDIDEETFERMKMSGALVVKSNNGSENKADVDIMTQELNQSETQVAKDDLWDNTLSILAIPNRENTASGGDTAGAIQLRNGWSFSKLRAMFKDSRIEESEKRLDTVMLNIIRQEKGANECPLGIMDFDVHISHSPTDNMLTKAEALQLLMQSGIHPLIAIKACGLWSDAEKVFLQSKPYLDNLYKTIYDELGADEVARQESTANELVNKVGGR